MSELINSHIFSTVLSILPPVIVSAVIIFLIIKKKNAGHEMDDMEGHEFEYYCADILRRAGFESVEVTKGSGDFGADILAEKEGVTYAFQCKCHDRPIGVKAVQEIYAGRDYYDRMVGVVMTNQYFTDSAEKLAARLKILLWNRDRIEKLDTACDEQL